MPKTVVNHFFHFGSRQELERLHEKCLEQARKKYKDRQLAASLTNDAFINALNQTTPIVKPYNYIMKAIHRLYRNHLRKSFHKENSIEGFSQEINGFITSSDVESEGLEEAFLQLLTLRQKKIVELRMCNRIAGCGGWRNKDIQETLNVTRYEFENELERIQQIYYKVFEANTL